VQQGADCDFQVVLDDRPGQKANAFQTLDRSGRPLLVFTLALLSEVQNEDELAFVFGHEAAHHILRHIERQERRADAGAAVFRNVIAGLGGDFEDIETAAEVGSLVASRRYGQRFELEADSLSAILVQNAGYDALTGAAFLYRIPDPGDRFLATHPPNTLRLDAVRKTLAE